MIDRSIIPELYLFIRARYHRLSTEYRAAQQLISIGLNGFGGGSVAE
jgi:hypothetical protein